MPRNKLANSKNPSRPKKSCVYRPRKDSFVPRKKLSSATTISTPQNRLTQVAAGKKRLQRTELEGILAQHALDADKRIKDIGQRLELLVQLLFDTAASEKLDSHEMLKMILKFEQIQRSQSAELCRIIDLLGKLTASSPVVKVMSTINMAAAQRIDNAINLGCDVKNED